MSEAYWWLRAEERAAAMDCAPDEGPADYDPSEADVEPVECDCVDERMSCPACRAAFQRSLRYPRTWRFE